jgi:hypothetical protein
VAAQPSWRAKRIEAALIQRTPPFRKERRRFAFLRIRGIVFADAITFAGKWRIHRGERRAITIHNFGLSSSNSFTLNCASG